MYSHYLGTLWEVDNSIDLNEFCNFFCKKKTDRKIRY